MIATRCLSLWRSRRHDRRRLQRAPAFVRIQTVAQAQAVVTEAIRRGEACDPESAAVCSGFGDRVIVTVLCTLKRVRVHHRIGATHDVRAVNAAVAVARDTSIRRMNEAEAARRPRAIVAAERAWVGLVSRQDGRVPGAALGFGGQCLPIG